jgi:hypothetical protein
MSLAFSVKAIRVQGIPKRANRAAMVIIAAGDPLALVFIRLMTATINHSPGVQMGIDGMQKGFKAKPGISSHDIHVQIRVQRLELQKQGRTGNIFMAVSRAHII